MDLHHILYTSAAQHELRLSELDEIMQIAVKKNSEVDVTGMLLYAGGNFMQVLEGPRQAVRATFARVERDARHHMIFVLDDRAIDERSFAKFSMGFRRLGTEDTPIPPEFAAFFSKDFDPESVGARPGLALEVLRGFADRYRTLSY